MILPESLIALLLLRLAPTAFAEPQWPHNVPRNAKYFPEDEPHMKRALAIVERFENGERPVGVKKMTVDEGEMFFLENWIWKFPGDEDTTSSNSSISPLSPLRRHHEGPLFEPMQRRVPRAPLFARDFKCPAGTSDCSSIGSPNSCCGTGSTCINVKDTGFGSVGCCASGQTCAGTISCDEKNGYSSCPESPNGGCCLPNYSCDGVGCIFVGTSVTYVQPSTSAVPSSSTAISVVPTEPPSSSASPTSYSCSSNWHSCPASLGGGCCQDGLECSNGASCLDPASTSHASSPAPSAPVRPTGPSSAATSSVTSTALQSGPSVCPTGFYVCSAVYPSGCCRVGRDCQTTGSCAPTASETIVNSNGVVVVAPTGASFATSTPQGGSCPQGWFGCAASEGGGCCLNGWSCGSVCTASGGQTSNKVAPASSPAVKFSFTTLFFSIGSALAIGLAMVIL